MSKEILLVVDAVSNEKGVNKEIIFEAIESALSSATRKGYGADVDVRVQIDRKSGDYWAFRRWLIVSDDDPEFVSPERQILHSYARLKDPDAMIGGYIEEPVEAVAFGRIAAQTAKQVIVQKVREAERMQIIEAFEHRIGELVMGMVKRSDRQGVIVDLGGNAEGFISRDDLIPRESVRNGDRIRGYLKAVQHEPRGPQVFLTRSDPAFLVELFKVEVPEIGQGLIEIMGAARDPGSRAKIAVRSLDPRLDPVGACVGMRGSRVQSVSNELAGERIDIILWNDNPAQYVINAMSPAEVVSIVVDEDRNAMDIAVADEKLSQAIGRNGQNVRLASQLTGWALNVMNVSEARAKNEAEAREQRTMFIQELAVDEDVADILVREGFSSIEEVAYVPAAELLSIAAFDDEIVEELRMRARDALLTRAIANEEGMENDNEVTDLLTVEGVDEGLANALIAIGVKSMEDLAEQAVDDLLLIDGLEEERAARLIMVARAPWFENSEIG